MVVNVESDLPVEEAGDPAGRYDGTGGPELPCVRVAVPVDAVALPERSQCVCK